MLMLSFIQLLCYVTFMTIRFTLELLVQVARLLAFIFRELLVPGARAASEGLVALAGAVARRRGEVEQAWTPHDDRQLQQWRERGRH